MASETIYIFFIESRFLVKYSLASLILSELSLLTRIKAKCQEQKSRSYYNAITPEVFLYFHIFMFLSPSAFDIIKIKPSMIILCKRQPLPLIINNIFYIRISTYKLIKHRKEKEAFAKYITILYKMLSINLTFI